MRIIAHIDMDAFFAAVEECYNPQFRGLPIVVGADPKQGKGRGVVSTASYAAREYGIRSALPISKAWQLAEAAKKKGEPATIFLTGQYSLYREVSDRIMAILEQSADRFEQASVDEAYLEWKSENMNSPPARKLPPTPRLWRTGRRAGTSHTKYKTEIDEWERAEQRAREIKRKILKQEGLTCSVGIGPNKLVAKIASDFRKPDGLIVVRPGEVEKFLAPLSVRAIPGIGPKGELFLNRKNIRTVSDLQRVDRATLHEWMGKWGDDLWDKARGISESEVSNEGVAKSISEEETFESDTLENGFILDHLRELAAYVFKRFEKAGFKSFRTVVLKIRFSDFTTLTRSRTSREPHATPNALGGEVLRLILPFLDQRENPRRKKIRLIGVRVEKLS